MKRLEGGKVALVTERRAASVPQSPSGLQQMALSLRSTIRSRAKEAESVEERIRVGGGKAKALMAI
jgi:hypothetical protein